jgi:hypothetical protein
MDEDNGCLNLPLRYGPVLSQESILVLGAGKLEAVLLVEPDGPFGISPCANENGFGRHSQKVLKELGADSFALLPGPGVRVPDEDHGTFVLDAHDADKSTFVFVPVEDYTGGDFGQELVLRHVGLVIAVLGYVTTVGAGAVIDDFVDCADVLLIALANHVGP